MPIYAYKCRKCGEKFESFRSISDDDSEVECPKCGAKNHQRELSSFYSKGSGSKGNLVFPT